MSDTLAHSLEPFNEHLESIFEAFYERLMSDRHFSVFFRNDDEVRSLVVRQREHLRAALYEDEAHLKTRYRELGHLHHRIFVPYPDFSVGIDFLAEQFYAVVSRMPDTTNCSAEQVFQFFHKVKNYTARGYLDCMLEEDKANLEVFIEHMQESRESLSGLLVKHLSWLNRMLRAIEREDEDILPDLEMDNSEFIEWILSDDAARYIVREEDRNKLFDLNRRIFTDARNIFYFIKTGHYTEVLVMFTTISKHLLTLTHLVTVFIANYRMRHMVRDPLTGLLNRQTMKDNIRQKLRLSILSQRPISVILTDLDDFKQVNDQFGHVAGDCILKRSAEILRRFIRTSDSAYRFGGEEFLLLLEDTDEKGARMVAESIREAVADTLFQCEEHQLRITMSLGVATNKGSRQYSPVDLISIADAGLYRAKRGGKNRVGS
ncbi:GGDEF domain-containing protein [Thiohalomonas denitrificans]|uniref:GGDEF domain-containing protein n=1 Tax=Thiohalomonas denitrificans TaxID=415747 RepID=UPI0026EB60F0|nr:GGDEF domain-containing protein [Thiohalomonas denitrificans]